LRGIGDWQAVELTGDKHKETPLADGTVAAVVRHMREKGGVLACALGQAFEMAPALTTT
jgi:adenosylmethionine-8-amino-7-oxononanoate aminotransferase